ncbi:AI-2E family transporter [Aneurinibacillus aneurinilyticus]|uniref:AI-2E family transporter n=1 Tax=Aneurinibacillus aneurinilyticus TaxID=1391 RepID=UPI0023F75F20|nr:AI-2E family transporter [Aneurinibacillus aneurinilyticus]MCI1696932.1 AI-2E family transporter [Aneurinibacillus aneurinilyticus]
MAPGPGPDRQNIWASRCGRRTDARLGHGVVTTHSGSYWIISILDCNYVIPALIVALTISSSMVLKVILVTLVVQMIEGNVITPHIIGRKLEVHPLTIISCFCLPEVCQV